MKILNGIATTIGWMFLGLWFIGLCGGLSLAVSAWMTSELRRRGPVAQIIPFRTRKNADNPGNDDCDSAGDSDKGQSSGPFEAS